MPNVTLYSLSGQSNYDICLKTIGSLDGFIKLLNDNKIQSSSLVNKSYVYNTNSILSKTIAGNNYSTASLGASGNNELTDNGTPISDNGTPLTDN